MKRQNITQKTSNIRNFIQIIFKNPIDLIENRNSGKQIQFSVEHINFDQNRNFGQKSEP